MDRLPVPPVPDLARISGDTRDEVVQWLTDYYNAKGAFFNYLCAMRVVKQSYKGYHNLPQLLAGCDCEKSKQGKKSNREVVSYAAPLAFNRKLQVVDLPQRQFAFGRDRSSSFRTPFFFVEDNCVKLYFLQPRKSFVLTFDQLCMVATIHKRYLLDNEFYGQPADVEYVDLSAIQGTNQRALQLYKMDDLILWSDKRLESRLTLISEAIDFIEAQGAIRPRKRQAAPISPDLPLF